MDSLRLMERRVRLTPRRLPLPVTTSRPLGPYDAGDCATHGKTADGGATVAPPCRAAGKGHHLPILLLFVVEYFVGGEGSRSDSIVSPGVAAVCVCCTVERRGPSSCLPAVVGRSSVNCTCIHKAFEEKKNNFPACSVSEQTSRLGSFTLVTNDSLQTKQSKKGSRRNRNVWQVLLCDYSYSFALFYNFPTPF